VYRGRANDGELFAVSVHDARDGLQMDVGELTLAAFMVRDRPLLIASDRRDIGAESALLCDALSASRLPPRHVIGAVRHAESFAAVWAREVGGTPTVAMRQRAYSLTSVDPPEGVSGVLRIATQADVDLVTDWTALFEAEALAGLPPHSSRAAVERRIGAGEVYLWCDPEPRTMASWARPTRRAIAVNGVFTPREWRQRGYATACVAALSSVLLRRGFEFCVLYTDLANPTSNSIYTKIGYRPVRDFLMYELSPSSAGS
jgi:predicted GNAT family acetyltransferase